MLKKNNINNIKYIIGMAGAQIYDFKTKQLIFNKVFDDVQIEKIKKICNYLNTNYYNNFTISIFAHNENSTDSINLINNESNVFNHYIGKYISRLSTNVYFLDFIVSKSFNPKNVYKVT